MNRALFGFSLVASFLLSVSARAAQTVVVNLRTNDIGWDSANGLVYASVPAASVINPNSLTPINPNTGGIGSPINLSTQPSAVVVSDDGSYVHVTVNDFHNVQRYNVAQNSLDLNFVMP